MVNERQRIDGFVADARKGGATDQQIYDQLLASKNLPNLKGFVGDAKSGGASDLDIAKHLGLQLQKDLGTQQPIKVQASRQPYDWKAEQQKAMLQEAKKEGPTELWQSGLLGFSKVGEGFRQGVSKLADMASSEINKALGTNLDTSSYDRLTQQRNDIRDWHNLRRQANSQGYDLMQLGGEIASTAPIALTGGGGVLAAAGRGTLIGGAIGATSYAKDSKERFNNTAFGGIGGAAGGAIGKGLGSLANKASEKISQNIINKALDVPKNQLSQAARDVGYTIPPSYSNPNVLNKSLAKVAGEADLAKIASSKNQDITNTLAKQSLGLPINKPITETALQSVRQQASQAYDVVRSLGKVKVDQTFKNDMDSIIKPYLDLANDFPLKVTDDVIKALNQAKPKNGEFEASAAIHAIRSLREVAKKAFKADDIELGRATKAASEALEKQLDRAVGSSNLSQNAIANFKNARQLIAKTHTIEDAMDEVGDVSANKLASILGKGAPLSAELKQAAQFASVYPQLNNVGRSGGGGISLFDSAAGIGGSMATGGTTGLAFGLTRPSLRYLLNSRLAGKMGTPSYNSPLANLLQYSDRLAPFAPAVGTNVGKSKTNQ